MTPHLARKLILADAALAVERAALEVGTINAKRAARRIRDKHPGSLMSLAEVREEIVRLATGRGILVECAGGPAM